ncbi:hypothetical protein [Leucobacter denitrificans]|uniref:NAD-dependent epimerase/dehydratase family protein n=1 Tax=Leucobacter denitrificans TaxID=683042 RepID=A0A7G9S7B2_9MICO|nr:hypothetical protein [Leucobacter denitrificans]QNN63737.1 hypothetical protein H9L06_05505 [Leucobacter denitrificans]
MIAIGNPTLIVQKFTPALLSEDESELSAWNQHHLDEFASRYLLDFLKFDLALNFNFTIVRPYITYSSQRVAFGIWETQQVIARMLDRRPIFIGNELANTVTSLTHSSDVAKAILGLLNNSRAYGKTIQIASPEEITWGDVYSIAAEALGVPLEISPISTQIICLN